MTSSPEDDAHEDDAFGGDDELELLRELGRSLGFVEHDPPPGMLESGEAFVARMHRADAAAARRRRRSWAVAIGAALGLAAAFVVIRTAPHHPEAAPRRSTRG